MDPRLWWYVARATGLTAWWLVSLAALWGLLLSTRVLGGRPAPAWLLDLHRWLGGLSLTFTVLHLAALVLDPELSFGWMQLLVPFAREANPIAQACGVLALYFLAAVQTTSLLKSKLPERIWRYVHRTAFVVFVSATAHTFTAGSDAGGPLVQYSGALIGAAFVFLVVYRLAAGRRVRHTAARTPAPTESAQHRGFHRLKVADVRQETADTVSVAFEVPDDLSSEFTFRPGQHLTLKTVLDGAELRRPYSICSGIADGELRVAVKAQSAGRMSRWVNTSLRAGDEVEVGAPSGRCAIDLNPFRSRHVLGIAAGSGITPILSIVKSTLVMEPRSRCTLVYGNRDDASTIFREELAHLEEKYAERLRVVHVLSRSQTVDPLFQGRLTREKFCELTEVLGLAGEADEAFMCGPEALVSGVRSALTDGGLAAERIHSERFTAGGAPPSSPSSDVDRSASRSHEVTLIDRGAKNTVMVSEAETVLDAGLRAGIDLAYSCREGICGTCRAKSSGGPVRLEDCDLEASEIEAGYVLACRTHPVCSGVTIDFDQQ
ncbi:2Fe-2S iron-sulfur cluster-binding protein [Streptomyces sp. NPDC005181]|uniref:2Fe-2S iron-sulfur cluster-binding protein n=1 Tax=Streptomyces sp. NPDC005181 TaxID=3156869 RepID=UPI00339F33F6